MIFGLMGLLKYKINRTKLLILTIISIFWTILFVGTYVDNHGDYELLIKYKPTFKFAFYSPIYHYRFESTKVFYEKELKEEKLYQEYVTNKNSIILTVLTLINLQLGFTFLSAFILDFKNKYDVNILQLLIHIVLCILFTLHVTLIFAYIYEFEVIYKFIILFLIVLFNLIILLLINKFKVIMNLIRRFLEELVIPKMLLIQFFFRNI